MKNKIFATIGGAVAALCPWVTHAETFPTDGNMLENKTYESAATYDNLGTYEGPVSATAEYADTLYQVGAGQYLPAGSEGVGAVCTAGNYCLGLTNATYNESSDQGLTACPNEYPMSDAGASMNTQCYTTCTDTSVIAHATAVAGNDYFGNGTDTCYATACDNGYHVDGTDPLIDVDPSVRASTVGYITAGSRKDNESAFGLIENNTWAAGFEYGDIYGQASCQSAGGEAMSYISGVIGLSPDAETIRSNLTTIAGEDAANAVADAYAEYKAGTKTEEEWWKVAYVHLAVEENADYSKTDSGTYCYCQMTAYSASGSSELIPVTSVPWVFEKNYDWGVDGCANNCASDCAYDLMHDDANWPTFRAAVLGALGTRTVGGVCVANEISITWEDADPADVAKNNAGVCTYDGDIRTPAKAITKPGKTFKGWKFNKVN